MKKSIKKTLAVSAVILLVITGFLGYYLSSILLPGFNIDKTVYIYIDKNKSYGNLLTQLDAKAHIKNVSTFKWVAAMLKYPDNILTGCYAITPNMSILKAVRMFRNGQQTPVNLTFNNIRTKSDLSERISSQLMVSGTEFLSALNDSAKCAEYGFTTEAINCMFIPNTYQIYWDIRPDSFWAKMLKEYNRFWTNERLDKAKAIGLSPVEVSILASIVEEECFFPDEYPVVAGLYLNRIRKGMLLQADPTIKFAIGDFSLKRVLYKHIDQAKSSAYSTYEYKGLPPGPIRVPSIKGIDAVLNPDKNNYIFMCAKDDFSGRHNFAVTNAEHEVNKARYHTALNKRKIFQ